MQLTLTGLGLFTRGGPRPTAIAVNLGLTPRPDRPWAVRASTTLLHPSPDGLARHVGEIERLAAVGKAVVAELSSVFAAAVTTDGTRTWLLYTAAAEVPAIDGVSLAVASDPAWAGYAALCPTPAEADRLARQQAEVAATAAARAATQATVRHLLACGVDLTRPATVCYSVVIPPEGLAAFTTRAAATGLKVDGQWFARADLPDLALIARTERWLIHAAVRAGGRYDGWTVAA